MKRFLTRLEIPAGQRNVFRALYAAGDTGLFPDKLCAAIACTPKELWGILGALGHRIQRT